MKRCFSLKGRKCFNEVYHKGKRIRGRGIQCSVLRKCEHAESSCPNGGDLSPLKIGINIGRRYGNACARNLAKRRIRSIIDQFMPLFDGGWCMIIRIHEEFRTQDFTEGRDSLEGVFSKAGLLRKQ